MKGKILAATVTDDISTVTKETKYGTYTCSVKVHDSDKDIANTYDGCYFAEMKCDIKAYHEKAARMKERAIGIELAYRALLDSNAYVSIEVKEKIKKQINAAWQQYYDVLETYKVLKESYYPFIETVLKNRRAFRKKINKRRQHFN